MKLKRKHARRISLVLGAAGTIAMLGMAFRIFPRDEALFGGVVLFVLAGLVRSLAAVDGNSSSSNTTA